MSSQSQFLEVIDRDEAERLFRAVLTLRPLGSKVIRLSEGLGRLLAGVKPSGYARQPTNHNAVAAAVAEGRADWGEVIESVAVANGLGFLPYQEERYDFVVPKSRLNRPAVKAILSMLMEAETRERLHDFGFLV